MYNSSKKRRRNLLELKQLQVKYEGAVGWNLGTGLAAICKLSGDCDSSLTTNLHTDNTDVHSLDDLARADLERESLSLFICCDNISIWSIDLERIVLTVKHFAIRLKLANVT